MEEREIGLHLGSQVSKHPMTGTVPTPQVHVSLNLQACAAFSVSALSHLAPLSQDQEQQDGEKGRRVPGRVIPMTTATSWGMPQIVLT